MQEKELYLKRIAGTLKHGRFQYEKEGTLWIIFAVIAPGCIGGLVALLVSQYLDATKFVNLATAIAFGVGMSAVFLFAPIATLVFWILPHLRKTKEIALWLDDSVELTAYAYRAGWDTVDVDPFIKSEIYKIGVRFHFGGKKLLRESRDKSPDGSCAEGYNNIWKKYIGQRVDILYSPKYDEVMILKPNGSTEYVGLWAK